MRQFISKQKNCIISLLSLVIICETLFRIDNRFMQALGILLTPFVAVFVFLIIRNDQKNMKKGS